MALEVPAVGRETEEVQRGWTQSGVDIKYMGDS
jgi:hypothetical protein